MHTKILLGPKCRRDATTIELQTEQVHANGYVMRANEQTRISCDDYVSMCQQIKLFDVISGDLRKSRNIWVCEEVSQNICANAFAQV